MIHAGVARTNLTPFHGVELTGWGYYLKRTWRRIHDSLYATALCVDDGTQAAILVSLDLMLIDESFTQRTRQQIQEATGLPPEAVLLTCTHSHNAPAAGGLLGVGACDPFYEEWASRQAATAAILAWQQREAVTLSAGSTVLSDCTFNRTREQGTVDPHVTVLRVDRKDGSPLAVVTNFAAHPTVCTELRPWDVSRDIPGAVCDRLEQSFPGSLAIYVQGACGDVNFLREYATPERCEEPARLVTKASLAALGKGACCSEQSVGFAAKHIHLPTRRWTRAELDTDRSEAEHRLAMRSTEGWRESIGRSMTNRPDDMVRRHGGDEWKAVEAMCRFHIEWTDKILEDLDTRAESLETEVQALRLGDVTCVGNSAELFSPFALAVRERAAAPHVMMACYANGRIGYLPDAHDIEARSYAGFQSPKYCNQFPFVAESGPTMVTGMLEVIEQSWSSLSR